MRPSTWSPESSRRRSGWCRTTCDGAWPGVSCTCHGAEVGLDDRRRGRRSRAGLERAAHAGAVAPAAPPPTPAAAPRARRSGARPRSGARARPRGRRRRGEVLVARVDPQLAAGPLPGSRRPGRSGRCARGCRRAAGRARAAARPARARARGGASSRARACPQSTSTIPSPAASAQALQCGTPGHGSGSRRRHTPGTTRSPRPTSVRRVGFRIAADANVPRMAADARSVADDLLRRARAPRPRGRGRLLGARRRRRPRRPGDRARARRRAGVLRRAVRRDARLHHGGRGRVAEGDRVAVRWRATGTFAGDADYQGIAPTGGRVELPASTCSRVRDGLIARNDAFTDGLGFARQIGMLPPSRARAPSSGAARVQRADAGGAQARGHAGRAGRRRRLARARRRPARR